MIRGQNSRGVPWIGVGICTGGGTFDLVSGIDLGSSPGDDTLIFPLVLLIFDFD